MLYSDIKKGCTSTRPKAPCLKIQSCLRVCYRGLEVESLIIERFMLSSGSTLTLVQTLAISEVSRLRTLSCLCATKPLFLHGRAWHTVYFSPQTHLIGKSDKGILYLKRRECLNSWGTAVSHELAPLSLDWLTNRSRSEGRVESILSILGFTDAVFKARCCLFNSSMEFSPATMNMLCVVTESTCGAVINVEAANCFGASNRKSGTPSPPWVCVKVTSWRRSLGRGSVDHSPFLGTESSFYRRSKINI